MIFWKFTSSRVQRVVAAISIAVISQLPTWQCLGAEESANQNRPNILLITADDLNFDTPGCYGGQPGDVTPNIDRLASVGIRFDTSKWNPIRSSNNLKMRERTNDYD